MMNILFFLSPKQDLMYVYDDFTLRQTLEKQNVHQTALQSLSYRKQWFCRKGAAPVSLL